MIKSKTIFALFIALFILSSCSELNMEAGKRLEQLERKTESLDSFVNREIDKVMALDSIVIKETDKVKKLDSIINKTSSRIDSISKEKIQQIENIIN